MKHCLIFCLSRRQDPAELQHGGRGCPWKYSALPSKCEVVLQLCRGCLSCDRNKKCRNHHQPNTAKCLVRGLVALGLPQHRPRNYRQRSNTNKAQFWGISAVALVLRRGGCPLKIPTYRISRKTSAFHPAAVELAFQAWNERERACKEPVPTADR